MDTSSHKTFTKTVKSWIAYDAGNSAFATTVVAAFFPIFYLEFWASTMPKVEASIYLNWTLVICNSLILLSGPVIGAYTDINRSTKSALNMFTIVGALFVGSLFFIDVGSWLYALIFFGIANYCFCVAQIPYDKILTKITTPNNFSIISNQGYAWGYFGGGALFLLNALMSIYPSSFGLASQAEAIRVSFLMVSIWWLLFLIPLFLNFKENKTEKHSMSVFSSSFKNIFKTLKSVYQYKNAFLFLIAFFLFIDGAHTVIYLATTFALNLGLETSSIIQALILVQFVAFPATLLWGYVANKYGDKLVLYITITSYICIIIYSTTLSSALEFYLLAAWVGFVQGGIQGSSRGMFGKLIPKEKAGEFFGLYNVMGRAGAILGPLMVGTFLTLYGNVRIALLPIAVLFIIGGLLLTRVKNEIV
ncbi:MFS transporter [Gammaproteobacteria bacterium]|nr:MFS transporter [Gammaproteobacteria bacterium]MDB4848264.1 MFS transporter [Gammaproteobacteria bacterium]MDC0401623.1 MFS transporter [Gammaproteobacteria bacterium]MDC1074330.1 MFS transporter [Gammaproteobacteria bacterium]